LRADGKVRGRISEAEVGFREEVGGSEAGTCEDSRLWYLLCASLAATPAWQPRQPGSGASLAAAPAWLRDGLVSPGLVQAVISALDLIGERFLRSEPGVRRRLERVGGRGGEGEGGGHTAVPVTAGRGAEEEEGEGVERRGSEEGWCSLLQRRGRRERGERGSNAGEGEGASPLTRERREEGQESEEKREKRKKRGKREEREEGKEREERVEREERGESESRESPQTFGTATLPSTPQCLNHLLTLLVPLTNSTTLSRYTAPIPASLSTSQSASLAHPAPASLVPPDPASLAALSLDHWAQLCRASLLLVKALVHRYKHRQYTDTTLYTTPYSATTPHSDNPPRNGSDSDPCRDRVLYSDTGIQGGAVPAEADGSFGAQKGQRDSGFDSYANRRTGGRGEGGRGKGETGRGGGVRPSLGTVTAPCVNAPSSTWKGTSWRRCPCVNAPSGGAARPPTGQPRAKGEARASKGRPSEP